MKPQTRPQTSNMRREVEDLKRDVKTMKQMLNEMYNMIADMVEEDFEEDEGAMPMRNGHRHNGLTQGGGSSFGGANYYEPPNN